LKTVGIIGLGKMGLNLAQNAKDNGFQIIGYDEQPEQRQQAQKEGVTVAESVQELISQLEETKIVWTMVPAGEITENVICEVLGHLSKGDIIIDGGNSNYKETIQHAKLCEEKEVRMLDCGTSGGMSGARNGACLMVGGKESAFQEVASFFKAIACEEGVLYTGKSGSGHYLKMVHNGIEYGMMQALSEGFEILEACEFEYDMESVAHVWNHGSVIRSWLVELAENAYRKDPKLANLLGKVDANGEGEWTVQSSLELKVPAPVIALSLLMRYRSKQDDSYAGKVTAALRNEFGGHVVTKSTKEED
jgi:6-phosphogluconate dehydrogenase (decarboxylating)